MKCPKCGFNSFEYYDSCRKCSGDLIGFKQTHSLTSMVLPLEAKEKLAAGLLSAESVTEQVSDSTETHDDIFSFDLPDNSPTAQVTHNDDPFNFDEPVSETKLSADSAPEEDVFSNLLESTSQADESPFGAPQTVPAAAKTADGPAGPGEFDLESFSWDDTPAAPARAANPESTEATDDFDSLFGDMSEKTTK